MNARRFLLLLFSLFALSLLIVGVVAYAQGGPSRGTMSAKGYLAPYTGASTDTPTATPTATCGPGVWTPGPPIPVSGIVRAVGVYYPANGKFYTMGGRTSDAAGSDLTNPYEYTPGSPGTWITKTATFPDNQVSNMACGVLTESGTPYIYCVGGLAATQTTATARVFRYDPVTDQITTLASADDWPGDTSGTIMTGGFAVVSNKLYIVGGFDILVSMTNETWEFDPTQPVGSKWTRKQDYPVARGYIPATSIGGMIYTGGGSDFQSGTIIDTQDSYKYDPVANNWTAIADIPRATGETIAVTEGGRMWVLGGGRTPPNPSYEADVYDPATNSWSLGAPFGPPARRTFPADSDGNYIWLVGGYTPTSAANTMAIYSPAVPCPPPSPTPWQFCAESMTLGPTWCDNIEAGNYSYRLRATASCTDFTSASLTFTPTLYVAPDISGPWTSFYTGSSQTIGGGMIWDITITDTLTVGPVPPPYTVYYIAVDQRWCVSGNPCSYVCCSDTEIEPLCSQTTPTVTVTGTPPTFTPIPTYSVTYSPSPAVNSATPRPSQTAITPTESVSITAIATASPPGSTATRTVVPTPTSCSIGFTDVPPGSTFYTFIRCMACRGIIGGYSSGCGMGSPCFRPNNNVTRGQLSKIVSLAAGFTEQHTTQTFADVPVGSTFYEYVERMASRGIIGGYPCGGAGEPCDEQHRAYFRPNANATRGQIAKIDVLSAVQSLGWTLLNPMDSTFEDVGAGTTFYRYVETAFAHSVLGGYPCGAPPAGQCVPPGNKPYFRPNNNATRGQTSKIVANTFFPDCDTPIR